MVRQHKTSPIVYWKFVQFDAAERKKSREISDDVDGILISLFFFGFLMVTRKAFNIQQGDSNQLWNVNYMQFHLIVSQVIDFDSISLQIYEAPLITRKEKKGWKRDHSVTKLKERINEGGNE